MTATNLPSGIALDELDEEVRPQDDLYRHVNGRWLARTEIPADKARFGSFIQLAEQAEADVRAIVEEEAAPDQSDDARKVRDLYASFMDTSRIEQLGAEPLAPIFERIDGIDDIASFLRVSGELDREGIASPIGAYVYLDPGDPERYVVNVVQSGISLPDESYFRLDEFAEIRDEFLAHVERMLTLAGVQDAAGEAKRVVELQREIASHHWDNVRCRDAVATYNLKTWDETQALAGVDLTPWRDAIGTPEQLAEVVVAQPSALEGLGALLIEDRVEDWKTWLRFQAVHSLAPYLSEAFVNENFAFYGTTLSGTPAIRDRWKRGVALVEGVLSDAIGQVYVDRHFPPEAKAQMDELVANLIEAYRQSITDLEWMSPVTREKALEKLDAFTPKIGYPVKWRTYDKVDIDPIDLVGNVRRANAAEHDRQLGRIGGPIDRDEWHMTPMTVNAYYNPLMNEIVFPAAILQYPFFDPNRDAAANYGGIGAVIGHEIGHGFDDQGSRFDGTGALRDWWTEEDRAAFEQRTAALIAQYDALTPQGLDESHHVNGALTIGENIGDLGGLGIAIKAYELAGASAGSGQATATREEIDSLTPIQRLLLSWGQVWQQKTREAEVVRLLTVDPHSPNEFRCNQIVRNVDAFYDAFGVTEADQLWLAPEERVTIW
ncbi:MAG: M13-type metalloendopeptidase [Microbacterium sp.]